MNQAADVEAALDIIKRGVDELIVESELRKKLETGRKLRIKFGLDPTPTSTCQTYRSPHR